MNDLLLVELLRDAARGSDTGGQDRLINAVIAADEREFRWLTDAGLGPLLYRAVRAHVSCLAQQRQDVLIASDLVAQVRHGEVVDTCLDLIDAAVAAGVQLTLLKGISIGDQYYPSAHLRPMSDIDVLVPVGYY